MSEATNTSLVPKLVSVSCTIAVVHDHLLGWDKETGSWLHNSPDMKAFPYGVPINGSSIIAGSMEDSNAADIASAGAAFGTAGSNTTPEYGDMPPDHKDKWRPWEGGPSQALFSAGTTIEAAYGNSKQNYITIMNITSGMRINFKAFLTGLSDSFKVRWDSASTYGRMDPIKSFQGTSRSVTLSWDVPAANIEEGVQNLRKFTNFAKMLYPLYTTQGNASSMMAPPMMAVRMTNLVSQGPIGEIRGLTGTLSGFTFSPDLKSGFFEVSDASLLTD